MIEEEDILEFPVPQAAFDRAMERHLLAGDTFKGSVMDGERRFHGYLAEEVVIRIVGAQWIDSYDYDFIYNGLTYDVKTKGNCKAKPKPYFWADIAPYNTHQKADFYIFTRLSADFELLWVVGCIAPERFRREAKLYRAGQLDPHCHFSYPFKFDMYKILACHLDKFLLHFSGSWGWGSTHQCLENTEPLTRL